MKKISVLLTAFVFSCYFSLSAQVSTTPSPIIFVYDASGSMWGKLQGKTKMEIASAVLSSSVDKLSDNQRIGLVAYGHRKEGDCRDVEFLVDVSNGTKAQIERSLKNIRPLGKTPLAYSAELVIDELRKSKAKATIILITDGIESCDGNICGVVAAAKKEGIDFKLHIIGFGLKAGESDQLRCAAKVGDGRYFEAADAGGLGDVLNEATAANVDQPAENISVYALKNGQPIDAYVVAYKTGTKSKAGVARTYSDTARFYLPPGKYDFEARPIRGDIESIVAIGLQSFEDKPTHRTIDFDGAKIQVSTTNNGKGWDTNIQVFDSKSKKPFSSARTYGKPRTFDLSPGTYDLVLRALAIEGTAVELRIENVETKAGGVAERSHDFKTGVAMIGAKNSAGLVDALVSITDTKTKKVVAGRRTYDSPNNNPRKFVLTSGNYQVKVRPVGKNSGGIQTFTIQITPQETVEKIITF